MMDDNESNQRSFWACLRVYDHEGKVSLMVGVWDVGINLSPFSSKEALKFIFTRYTDPTKNEQKTDVLGLKRCAFPLAAY